LPRRYSNDVTRSEIGLVLQDDLGVRLRTSYRVDSGTQEEQVNDNVCNLLQKVKAGHLGEEKRK
jgi:hypothetical protein